MMVASGIELAVAGRQGHPDPTHPYLAYGLLLAILAAVYAVAFSSDVVEYFARRRLNRLETELSDPRLIGSLLDALQPFPLERVTLKSELSNRLIGALTQAFAQLTPEEATRITKSQCAFLC